eukprot:gb/GECG01005058.1/.p1 GENE.gb/GECG01005058.1/~~gb/GECG01005058.1/.p1  ORF type:complete len:150 (+),score=22.71 gb/GECG01005058.1/:1-450(+)
MEFRSPPVEEEESDFLSAASSASIGDGSSGPQTEREEEEDKQGVPWDASQMVSVDNGEVVSHAQWRLVGKDEEKYYNEQERQRATSHALDLALEDILYTTSGTRVIQTYSFLKPLPICKSLLTDPRLLAEFIAQLSQMRESLLQRQVRI